MKITLSSPNYIELTLLDEKKRDLLLILPGGGYEFTSAREAEPVAQAFRPDGYHTAIYYYREEKLLYPNTKLEGKEVLDLLSANPLVKRIFIIGFSSGGHLAATLLEEYPKMLSAGILAYPVITSNIRFRHAGSFLRLLGDDLSKDTLEEVSLERHVNEKMPPIFLFHTMDDASVPAVNSQLFLEMLRMKHVPVEAHFFPKGRHGVSIATKEVAFSDMDPDEFVRRYGYLSVWVDLARDFLKRLK